MRIWTVIALGVLSIAASNFASAREVVKVAVPHRGSWDTSYTELGLEQGFFREFGIDLELTFTANSAANQNALTSGAADIAVGTRFVDVLVAYTQGAPVRIVSAELTGAPDIFWYAKIAGPTASFQDLHGKAVSYCLARIANAEGDCAPKIAVAQQIGRERGDDNTRDDRPTRVSTQCD